MRSLHFITAFLLTVVANAQTIHGKILKNDKVPIEFATVILFQAKDSSLVKGAISETDGRYEFEGVSKGNYYITASYIGFEDYKSNVFEYDGQNLDLGMDTMITQSAILDQVTVTARKPFLEVKADKTVLNIDASLTNTGLNGLELLRKSPGVTIDNNENIQLKGKSGVRIYIDGKPSYLNEQELANLLKGLTSADIEAIEIITNPSAKFDAQGGAGIINLKLRKNKNFGTNGTLNVNAGYGKYHKLYTGVNLNNRNKKLNTFGSFGIGDNKSYNTLNLYRIQSSAIFDQHQSQISKRYPINGKLGMDYSINDKHTVGALMNANTNYLNRNELSTSITSINANNNPGKIDSVLFAENETVSNSINSNFNVNYRFADTLGNELTFDLDKGIYRSTSMSTQPNDYYNNISKSILLSTKKYLNDTPSDIDIMTAKIDYSKAYKNTGTALSFGLKYAHVTTDNTLDFYQVVNQVSTKDLTRSNQFIYTEEVSAGYINLTGNLTKKWLYQAGLRAEHTHSIGDLQRDPSVPSQTKDYVDRNYINYFPSGALTYNLNQDNTFNLTYSKRINRPDYENLNPFEWRIDELTFRKGNPYLTPQFNDNLEFSYTIKQAASVSLAYSHSIDVITDIVEKDLVDTKKSFINYRNIASQDNYALSINSPLPIKPWWNGYLSTTLYQTYYKADFEEYSFNTHTPIAFSLYAENNFNLSKTLTYEISGWFNSTSIWGGTWISKPQGSLNMGFKKTFWDNNASVKIGVQDLLFTSPWNAVSDAINGLYIKGGGSWESRRIDVNFTYKFGNSSVKNANTRKSGLEDENKRLKG